MHLKVIIPFISEMSSMCHSIHFFTYFTSLSLHECFAGKIFVKSFDRYRI